jgi:hypothetical protein
MMFQFDNAKLVREYPLSIDIDQKKFLIYIKIAVEMLLVNSAGLYSFYELLPGLE